MSKNITIQEGGVAKQLIADKLKTNLADGGTCIWVPEDEAVGGIVSGKHPDMSGDDAVATVDSNGVINLQKIPSEIKVITPPTVDGGVYIDGQAISTEGMVVKAYYGSGREYGIVPNAEITLTPSVATYDSKKDVISGTATSELDTGCEQPIHFSSGAYHTYSNSDTGYVFSEFFFVEAIVGYTNEQSGRIYILCGASSQQVGEKQSIERFPDDTSRERDVDITATASYTYDNKTVYYSKHGLNDNNDWSSGYPDNEGVANGKDVWTALYGSKQEKRGAMQNVTVSWPRPGDGRILTCEFQIVVQQASE